MTDFMLSRLIAGLIGVGAALALIGVAHRLRARVETPVDRMRRGGGW